MTAPDGILAMWRKNRGKQHLMRKITHILDEHYPELLGAVLLTNAPWAVHAIIKILWPVLPARISEKIQVIPVVQTAERMCELVNPASLPHFLGGEIPDDDFVPSRSVRLAASSGEVVDGGVEIVVGAGKKDERGIWLNSHDTAGYGFTVLGT